MATLPGPEADGDSPLSLREQRILAAIEAQLARSDPALARKLARVRPVRVALPGSPWRRALLGIVVLFVMIAGTLQSMLAAFVTLTVVSGVIVLPAWLLLLMIERGERGGGP